MKVIRTSQSVAEILEAEGRKIHISPEYGCAVILTEEEIVDPRPMQNRIRRAYVSLQANDFTPDLRIKERE